MAVEIPRVDGPASPDSSQHLAVQYLRFCLVPFLLSLVIPAAVTVGVATLLAPGTQDDVGWHNLAIGVVLNTTGWAIWALGVWGTVRNGRKFRAARSRRVAWARGWHVICIVLAFALSIWGVMWTLFFLSPPRFLP